MVTVIREASSSKKSKLSLFRLGKLSKSMTPSQPASSPTTHHYDSAYPNQAVPQQDYPSAPNRHPSTAAADQYKASVRAEQRRERQVASEGSRPSRPASPSSSSPAYAPTSVKGRPPRQQASPDEIYRRQRADSLPMHRALGKQNKGVARRDGYIHYGSKPALTVLTRLEAESKNSHLGHSRQRSHFSIPDVVVTTCEEEGNEQLVELQIPPSKRRTYFATTTDIESERDPRPVKKSNRSFSRKPAPLIQFSENEMRGMGMTKSDSLSSLSGASLTSSPVKTNSPSSPSSSPSSSLSKSAITKRVRKGSLPFLFGRKSLESFRSFVQSDPSSMQEPLPTNPIAPSSAPARDRAFYQTAADASMPSLPSSSHESLSGATYPRPAFARGVDLPTPPITPTSPYRYLSKKELKAKAKEEQALIKELERVDRLVKQHDLKAQKAADKAEAKERKRAAKLALVQDQTQLPSRHHQADSRELLSQTIAKPSKKTITVFSASTRGASPVGLGRRPSFRGRDLILEVEKKPHPPLAEESRIKCLPPPLSSPSSTTGSSHDFEEPVNLASVFEDDSTDTILPETLSSPPIQASVAASNQLEHTSILASLQTDALDGTGNTSEDIENQAWSPDSWSSLEPAFAGPLPSLVSGNSHRKLTSSAVKHDVDVVMEVDDEASRSARRASVQRILTLSDAEGAVLQKRASLRKRTSKQMLKRRSSYMDGIANIGPDSKRSSVTSDITYKRRSLITPLGETEGWQVVDEDQESHHNEEAEEVQDINEWEEELATPATVNASASILTSSQQALTHEQIQVDKALADLQAAQMADEIKKSLDLERWQTQLGPEGADGERTPTQETVSGPFGYTSEAALASTKTSEQAFGPATTRETTKDESSSTSPPRPTRSTRRHGTGESSSPTRPSHHQAPASQSSISTTISSSSASTSSTDLSTSFSIEQSARKETSSAETMIPSISFSAEFPPSLSSRFSLVDDAAHQADADESIVDPYASLILRSNPALINGSLDPPRSSSPTKNKKAEYRISFSPLQPLDLFGSISASTQQS